MSNGAELLTKLRADGWSVAVHNDYRCDGETYTFWLLTHPSGVWVKGEGVTDGAALVAATLQAEERLRGRVERPSFDAVHGRRVVEDTNADPEGCNRGCGRKAVRQVPVFGGPMPEKECKLCDKGIALIGKSIHDTTPAVPCPKWSPGISANVCEHDDRTPGSGLVDMHRDELPISGFARRVMRGRRVNTLRELSCYSYESTRLVRGAGPKVMAELNAILTRAGLSFDGSDK